MKSNFENKFTALFGIITLIFTQLVFYFNLLMYESVSIFESITISDHPNYYVILSTLPSLFISIIIFIKMGQRHRTVKNNVSLYMLLFITCISITLLATILAYSTTGPGTLSLYFDRTTFITFVTSTYYLYLFMNEVFREPENITIIEKITIWICLFFPLIITAYRQTVQINKIVEGIGLGLAAIVILVPNIGIAIFSIKISKKMKKSNSDTEQSNKGFRYIFLSAIFQIIFTIFFVIIVLEELYNSPFFYFTMMIVAIMMILFYKGYVKPK